MIAPQGYYCWDDLLESVWEWAEGIESRQEYELPRDPKREELTRSLLRNYLIANYLYTFEPLLCSRDGRLFHAPKSLWLHGDRLDATALPEFSGSVAPFNLFYERSRMGMLSKEDIGARFCAIDPLSGTVRLKNNSRELFEGAWLEGGEVDAAYRAVVELQGMSLCWSPDDLPDTVYEVVDILGLSEFFPTPTEAEEIEASCENELKRNRGRPSDAPEIVAIYDALFPKGHKADGHYWDVVTHMISQRLGKPLKVATVARSINRRPAP